ncbi:hypothetical protein PHLGIDRAFT_204066 [Phlebiopsis gigantea 11061_1 CR5-6]|uniref:Uncharacterized protein n=1 Tax=Phlebiopsis gigantea (strain 11061_1 CR5-6) TaxID=745531 RepID=A0A0C3S6M5_PHLG1|nr:hypothetical protein PHLGIDRAFT_204066 [Phlebiopsis gigantea 11061_1 CR5-6]
MSSASDSGRSTPTASTPLTSAPGSPPQDPRALPDPTDEAKAEATRVKAQANKAFLGTRSRAWIVRVRTLTVCRCRSPLQRGCRPVHPGDRAQPEGCHSVV